MAVHTENAACTEDKASRRTEEKKQTDFFLNVNTKPNIIIRFRKMVGSEL